MSFRLLHKILGDRRGSVAMMYALMLPALMFGAGFAIDYTHAMQVQTELDAAADVAVLAALTPAMMQQSNAAAQTEAENLFSAEASAIPSVLAGKTSVTVNVVNPNGNALTRNVTVSYVAANTNIFSGVLGSPALQISGTSTANASIAAINFYLLLDNSPSMALPATQAGINTMISLTAQQDNGEGCAFACHQAFTGYGAGPAATGDTIGNPCALTSGSTTTYSAPTLGSSGSGSGTSYCAAWQGTQIDNYQIARNNNVTLRLDQLSSAVATLMNTAYAAQNDSTQATPPKYEFAAYSMDTLWSVPSSSNNLLMSMTSNYTSGWTTAAANFGIMKMYYNNYLCATSACTSGVRPNGQGDVATNYDVALSSADAAMPDPGNGANVVGDSPQEVLFFVTDGVEDELSGSVRVEQQINGPSSSTDYCTTIKNRGIRIAVLYTAYLPVPNDNWYEQNVAPFQPDISSALEACASPGLFYQAAIGDDLGAALSNLFEAVAQSAHLTN